jgi:signal transduction histidine kinase
MIKLKISLLKSIKFKLIVFLVIISFLPLLIFSFINISQSKKIIQNELTNNLLLKTKLLSTATTNYLEERANQVRLITQADVLEGNKFLEIQQYIKEVKATTNEIIDIDIYDLNGKRLASADDDDDIKERGKTFYEEYSIFEDLYNKTKNGRQNDVLIGINPLKNGNQEIILLSPITNDTNKEVVKVLLVQLSFENIEILFKSSLEYIKGLSNLSIINSNGDIIISVNKNNNSKKIKNKSQHAVLKHIEELNENSNIYLDEKLFNLENFISFSKIKFKSTSLLNMDWYITTMTSKEEVLRPIQLLISIYLKVALIIFITLTFIIIYLYYIIINPLSKTIYKINEITNGDYEKRLSEFSNGEIRNLENAFNSLLDKINVDFNQLKETNYSLEKSLEREKELGILKTRFVSMASHEFRTPLTSINATTDVILNYADKLSKEDIEKRLYKIKNEIADMTTTLEDILIIGKAEAQKLKFTPVEIDFVKNVKFIIDQFQLAQIEPREIVYEFSDDSILINADPKWIKNIVINLISNAIKYSKPTTKVEIGIKKENETVILTFSDKGVGISKKDQKKLFEPFHRGENVDEISGTGLGLAVVQKAVELHNGKILFTSELNKGTTFKIILPTK